jgi:hypothetical protein
LLAFLSKSVVKASNSFLSTGISYAATANALTQGVGKALKMQDHFDWRSLAVAAITAPIAQAVGKGVDDLFGVQGNAFNFGSRLTGNFVNGVIAQEVRIKVYHQGKMDYESIAADAFGNALGSAIMEKMKTPSGEQKLKDEQAAKQAVENSARNADQARMMVADASGSMIDGVLSPTEVAMRNANATPEDLKARLQGHVDQGWISPEKQQELLNDPNLSADTLKSVLDDNIRQVNKEQPGLFEKLLGDASDKVKVSTALPPDTLEAFKKAGLYTVDANGIGNIAQGKEKAFWDFAKESGLERAVTVNGVWNSEKDGYALGERTSQMSGKIVTHIYNPTEGKLADVLQSAAEILAPVIDFKDSTMRALAGEINSAVAYNKLLGKDGGNTIVLGHSQGTIIANDVIGGLTADARKHIDLINVATATPYVPSGLHSYKGFINVTDPVSIMTGGFTTLLTAQWGDNYKVKPMYLAPGAHENRAYMYDPKFYGELKWNPPKR